MDMTSELQNGNNLGDKH